MVDFKWLDEFVSTVTAENAILSANGAACQVEARERLVEQLRTAATGAENETVSVDEAAKLTGVNPETVRRAVRRGEIPDPRASKKQTIRIRKADLPKLTVRKRRKLAVSESAVVAGDISRFKL